MATPPVLVWFRNDLRIEDNPALFAARESGAPVIPFYVLDEDIPHSAGAASRWWLHHSLTSLADGLAAAGERLILRKGDTQAAVKKLVKETGANRLYWNRRYYPKHVDIDKALKTHFTKAGVSVESFNAGLLREPWEVENKSGDPYRVFTPFWKSLRAMGPSRQTPAPRLRKIEGPSSSPDSDMLDDWRLTPSSPDWAKEFSENWSPGEQGAKARLRDFLSADIDHYAEGRDRPDRDYTSRLSPHLSFGEIGPLQIWREVKAGVEAEEISDKDADKFLSEIAWREFSYSLLFYNKELPETPLRREFGEFAWQADQSALRAWRRGRTGYPIVDAGMRQLWRTGWMHNRVRMIVASFLIKDLRIDWREGEAWFWDTLVDADLANNAASWQWVAGCGADAAPFFRIFNPVTQGEKFDPQGDYVRAFVPELKDLPAVYIHKPWEAPEDVLEKAGVRLGNTYPIPIINHAEARKRALEEYDRIKAG